MWIIRLVFAMSGTACASPKTIACVGDSITEGSHSSSKSYSYPAQLQVRLDIAFGTGAYNVVNLGVSGATAQKAADKPYWRTKEYMVLTMFTWDIAIVMLGTNGTYFNRARVVNTSVCNADAKWFNWNASSSGCSQPRELGSQTFATMDCPFAKDLTALIRSIPASSTLLAIPPPLMEDNSYSMSQQVINGVFPSLIPEIAHESGCKDTVDAFGALGGMPNWEQSFPCTGCTLDYNVSSFGPCIYYCSEQSCDQCHPNDVGYARLAEAMAKSVSRRALRERGRQIVADPGTSRPGESKTRQNL